MSSFLFGAGDSNRTTAALLPGRAGGQVLQGGTAASEDLTLESTAHATKGDVLLQPNGGNVGINTDTTAPTAILSIKAPTTASFVKVLEFDGVLLDAAARKWNFYLSRWTNAGSARLDSILSLGYNQDAGGGALDATDHALYMQFENFYQPGATAVAEWHINFTAANNAVVRRPLQINVQTDGSVVDVFHTATSHKFLSTTGAQIMTLGATIVDMYVAFRWLTNNVAVFKQINAAGNQVLDLFSLDSGNYFRFGGALAGVLIPAGNFGVGTYTPSTRLDIDAGALTFAEMTAPGAGAANTARIYAKDNGAGKTQLMVQFATGSEIQLAIEA